MKQLSLIFCFLPVLCFAQIDDRFSDGNFSENPSWVGNADRFIINQQLQLQLKSSGTDTSCLFTRNYLITEAEWTWWMKLSFNTSANNFARIYFVADTNEVEKISSALFLQTGGGDDSLSVYEQNTIGCTKILTLSAYLTNHSTNCLRIKILHPTLNDWELFIDSTGGCDFYHAGTFTDSINRLTHWLGLFCKYTSSNSSKFYFDDFYVGPIRRDTIPPKVLSAELLTDRTLELSYSEIPEKSSAENPLNYIISSHGENPTMVTQLSDRPATVILTFNNPIPERTCDSLMISAIFDPAGNIIQDSVVGFCWFHPLVHEIVINELLADPEPAVGLPEGEFVELYNKTVFPVNLKNWTFSFGNNKKTFPSVHIEPEDYLIIAKDSLYQSFGRCAWLFTSASSLSNEGTQLVLRDADQRVIHALKYEPGWYQDSFKAEGGWSLEMKDPDNPCGCSDNWSASIHPLGGTPGALNSVSKDNPDVKPPCMTGAFLIDTNLMEIRFSEAMDSMSLQKESFSITGSNVHEPEELTLVPPDYQNITLRFLHHFDTGMIYQIRVDTSIHDCSGNPIDELKTIQCAIPAQVNKNDLIINEFLPDPYSGGVRFMELYNRSEKVVNLESLVVAGKDTSGNMLPEAFPIEERGNLLFPGAYRVLTTDASNVQQYYWCPAPECFTEMKSFPVFYDDSGTLILARKYDQMVIDRVRYYSGMHFPLLVSHEGISLERYHPDRPSVDVLNWHSSSETNGFATPGYLNSHRYYTEDPSVDIEIQPAVFSPDNDGFNDLLSLTLRNIKPDQPINITIFDKKGMRIRCLANNVLAGESAVFVWDGMSDDRQKAPTGIYIVLIEFTSESGVQKSIKKAVILSGY